MARHLPIAVATLLALAGCETSGTDASAPAPAMASAAPVGAPRGDIADLVGTRAAGAETQMGTRGYAVARQQGLTAFWCNPSTGTCAKTITNNGRYETVATAMPSDCGQA